MSTPYVAEIRIVSFNFPPKGWAFCNGQTLPISQNAALFSLLGTAYGGNGTSNFQLPNFQGALPMHTGSGFALGQFGGEVSHTLDINELPQHTHIASAIAQTGNSTSPDNNLPAEPAASARYTTLYGSGNSSTQFDYRTVVPTGGSQPHENRQPSLVLNFVIALIGIYPTRE